MAAINLPQPRRGVPVPLVSGQVNLWVLAALAVVGIAALLPVLQNSTATTRGFDVQRLTAEGVQLRSDISFTESEVASLTSMARIKQRAAEIGLVPGDTPYYISVTEPGPAPAKIPSEYLPGPVPSKDRPAPWWRSLFSWVALGN